MVVKSGESMEIDNPKAIAEAVLTISRGDSSGK